MIFLIVALLPFSYYLYRLVPEGPIWETSLFTIYSWAFEDVYYMFFVFARKVLLLVGCLIWFFTCRHWWRNVLLLPIVITLIQIFVLFDEDTLQLDEVDYWYVIPLGIALIASIHWFGNKINYYSKTQELLMELDKEIEMEIAQLKFDESEAYEKGKKDLAHLKSVKNRMSPKDYVLELIEIKNQLQND